MLKRSRQGRLIRLAWPSLCHHDVVFVQRPMKCSRTLVLVMAWKLRRAVQPIVAPRVPKSTSWTVLVEEQSAARVSQVAVWHVLRVVLVE